MAYDITYNLALFSTQELVKPVTRRKPIAGYLVLKNDMSWEDFYAQLKTKICDSLFPGQAVVNDNAYRMMFSVPRHVTNPINLVSAADYAHLLTNASKIKTNPSVKVIVESHAQNLVRIQLY